ncbi:MAG: elongation factor Ts, partial [Lentimonas sp.]|jgi:elongation factor Ts
MSVQITAKMVGELRESTGAGLMNCKKALVETDGDFNQATELLRKKGEATAAKKAGRDASEGIVDTYIHLGGKVGVLIEVNCESDFVAKTDDFKQLVRDIAMHVAAVNPACVSRDDIDPAIIDKERKIAEGQAEGKPEQAIAKIVEGKLNKFLSESCLLEQAFVKNSDQTVQELLTSMISKMGENIVVKRFARFQVGA